MALTMKHKILDEDAYVNASPNKMQHCWLDQRLQNATYVNQSK